MSPAEHSWHPLDVLALAANPPEPPTIGGLLYPGTPVTARSVYAAEAADAARILLTAGGGGADAIRAGTFEGETGRISFTTAWSLMTTPTCER